MKLFVKRHEKKITIRTAQNITNIRKNAKFPDFQKYFEHLKKTLHEVQPENILNYDETYLADCPNHVEGRKCVFRKTTKYPERIQQVTKSKYSIMQIFVVNITVDNTMLKFTTQC